MLNPDGEHLLLSLTSAIGDQLVRFIAQYSPQPRISHEMEFCAGTPAQNLIGPRGDPKGHLDGSRPCGLGFEEPQPKILSSSIGSNRPTCAYGEHLLVDWDLTECIGSDNVRPVMK